MHNKISTRLKGYVVRNICQKNLNLQEFYNHSSTQTYFDEMRGTAAICTTSPKYLVGKVYEMNFGLSQNALKLSLSFPWPAFCKNSLTDF